MKMHKGAVLGYTIILLGIVLVAALGYAYSAQIGIKTSSDTDKSVQAFQIADTGSEKVLTLIKTEEDPSSILENIGCNEDSVTGSIRGGEYRVVFIDESGNLMACNQPIADVKRVKSSGTYGGTTRVIEASVSGAETAP